MDLEFFSTRKNPQDLRDKLVVQCKLVVQLKLVVQVKV